MEADHFGPLGDSPPCQGLDPREVVLLVAVAGFELRCSDSDVTHCGIASSVLLQHQQPILRRTAHVNPQGIAAGLALFGVALLPVCNVVWIGYLVLISPRFSEFSYWNYREVCELFGARYPAAPLGLITVAALLPQHWDIRLLEQLAAIGPFFCRKI